MMIVSMSHNACTWKRFQACKGFCIPNTIEMTIPCFQDVSRFLYSTHIHPPSFLFRSILEGMILFRGHWVAIAGMKLDGA